MSPQVVVTVTPTSTLVLYRHPVSSSKVVPAEQKTESVKDLLKKTQEPKFVVDSDF